MPFEACEVSYMYYHILNNYYIYTILYACPAVDLHVYMCSCFHTRTLTEFWTYVPLSEVITRYYEYLDRILYLWILCVCVCAVFVSECPSLFSFIFTGIDDINQEASRLIEIGLEQVKHGWIGILAQCWQPPWCPSSWYTLCPRPGSANPGAPTHELVSQCFP